MGGGAGGSFSDLAAATTIVSGMTAVSTVLDLPVLVECILNIDRRIRSARLTGAQVAQMRQAHRR